MGGGGGSAGSYPVAGRAGARTYPPVSSSMRSPSSGKHSRGVGVAEARARVGPLDEAPALTLEGVYRSAVEAPPFAEVETIKASAAPRGRLVPSRIGFTAPAEVPRTSARDMDVTTTAPVAAEAHDVMPAATACRGTLEPVDVADVASLQRLLLRFRQLKFAERELRARRSLCCERELHGLDTSGCYPGPKRDRIARSAGPSASSSIAFRGGCCVIAARCRRGRSSGRQRSAKRSGRGGRGCGVGRLRAGGGCGA